MEGLLGKRCYYNTKGCFRDVMIGADLPRRAAFPLGMPTATTNYSSLFQPLPQSFAPSVPVSIHVDALSAALHCSQLATRYYGPTIFDGSGCILLPPASGVV